MASFNFPRQTAFYKGKVRDVYTIADKYLVMLASDRISAFDVILPRPIPFKGQVLTQIAAHMLRATADICPNWLMSVPAP
ncbi:MAG TPA: phosphoribosylaminoimidazolesuccinocarboxamide synthase, partial [Ferruginibacter sp.]|nr:phosphoribosylaminoimidazolesuccinocarboxamide synthase [Ferruginibacter sp.]